LTDLERVQFCQPPFMAKRTAERGGQKRINEFESE
jgi:hypothetical protein